MRDQVVIDLDSDENPEESKSKAPSLQMQGLKFVPTAPTAVEDDDDIMIVGETKA
jgi:hypothetical protein